MELYDVRFAATSLTELVSFFIIIHQGTGTALSYFSDRYNENSVNTRPEEKHSSLKSNYKDNADYEMFWLTVEEQSTKMGAHDARGKGRICNTLKSYKPHEI